MADPHVDDLIRRINQLVVEDTGGVSAATGDRLPGVTRSTQRLVDGFARDLGGLANGEPERAEQSWERTRSGLTEIVASCAYTLEGPALDTVDSDAIQFSQAAARLYAKRATAPRLLPRLLPDGAQLDAVPDAPLTTGEASVWAVAIGISDHTRRDPDDVLTEMVAAGRGGTGLAAARIVMGPRHGFGELAELDQQAIVRMVATQLEARFAGPADSLDQAVSTGDIWLDRWRDHAPLRTVDVPAPPRGLPEDVPELLSRIEGAVIQLTRAPRSLWSEETEELHSYAAHPVDLAPDGVLYLHRRTAELPLEALTKAGQNGSLSPQQVAAARLAMQAVSGAFVRFAAPDDYTRAAAELADVDLRLDAISEGAQAAFTEDIVNQVIDQTLPAELAERLRTAEPPYAEIRFAPAARGFANTIDTILKRESEPSETLRVMAGQGRSGVAAAAAADLVADSAVPAEQRPEAVRAIATKIGNDFDALHGKVAPWTNTPIREVDSSDPIRRRWSEISSGYGQEIARQAQGLVEEYENGPAGAVGERDPAFRLHADQAQQPLGSVPAPSSTSAENRAAGRANPAPQVLEP